MVYIEVITVLFLGLILGSFSTALIYRIPKKVPWGMKRSACPECKAVLGVVDLIPLFSWLVFRGNCRSCKAAIPVFYPLMECSAAVACLALYFVFGLNVASLLLMASVPVLLSLFIIDLKYMILPNQLVFALLVIGLVRLLYFSVSGVFVTAEDMFVPYFGGAVLYALLSWGLGALTTKVVNKDSLGLGDVKFFFVAGFWLGLELLPYFLVFSGLLGILFGAAYKYISKKDAFPFGPALISTFFLLLFF